MIYREKGGSQAAFSENAGNRAIVDLQNAFLSKCRSDLPGTVVWVLEFILNYFVLIFSCESSRMRVNSMGLVFQALDISVAIAESLEVTVYPAEWNALFFADFLGLFLTFQDGTDQLILLC
jgi:hypothetical protein